MGQGMKEVVEAAKKTEAVEQEDSLARSRLLSGDLVIGLIGYAGAGCTDVYKRLNNFLSEHKFEPHHLKLSDRIAKCSKKDPVPVVDSTDGKAKLNRAILLQDLGDKLRDQFGGDALASLAIREIKSIRSAKSEKRRALILDSLKHPDEIALLRRVYENSFLLLGVYCGKDKRLERLQDKFFSAERNDINKFMDRDEKDPDSKLGQQVRKAFHQADFFLDNSIGTPTGHIREYDEDLRRFVDIMEGGSLIRPTSAETAMYYAYSASLRSSCLSRQVGAAVTNENDEVVSTGTNEVPAYGGGVYRDDHIGEQNRCFKWEWWEKIGTDVPNEQQRPCCHNTRKKNELRVAIANWMRSNIPTYCASHYHPKPVSGELDLVEAARKELTHALDEFLANLDSVEFGDGYLLDGMPGIGDLIEYSRSIHAEMDAILNAARNGEKLINGSVYVTTYPCHHCARHLVAAGIKEVRFLEPYDKSLAVTLHWDSIENEGTGEKTMSIKPYTGIGPRVYEEYFLKRGELKDSRSGFYTAPAPEHTRLGVRLLQLGDVEDLAIKKLPEEVAVEI